MGARQSITELPDRQSNIFYTYEPNKELKEWLNNQQKGISEDEDFFEVIDPQDVVIKERIGGGHFGEVFLANFKGVKAAAKKLSTGVSIDINLFKREVCIMRNVTFKYEIPYVCPYIGVVYFENPNNALYLLMQLANLGSLDRFLQQTTTILCPDSLLEISLNIAIGMAGLHNIPVVHRDLALRNILINKTENNKLIPQITDFGLSECACKVKNRAQDVFPVKWTAPEVIFGNAFTTAADVWSYGITLWELYSNGRTPYSQLSNQETVHLVSKGYRLQKPQNCPAAVYQLMLECWDLDPEKRPTFYQIMDRLDSLKNSLLQTREKDVFSEVTEQQPQTEDYSAFYEGQPYKKIPELSRKPSAVIYNNLGFILYQKGSICVYEGLDIDEVGSDSLQKVSPAYEFTPLSVATSEERETMSEKYHLSRSVFSNTSHGSSDSRILNAREIGYAGPECVLASQDHNQNQTLVSETNSNFDSCSLVSDAPSSKKSVTEKPMWTPDFTSRVCQLCMEPFPVMGLMQKHHCRACGRLVDHKCSQHLRAIPLLGFSKPVRVCDQCIEDYEFP